MPIERTAEQERAAIVAWHRWCAKTIREFLALDPPAISRVIFREKARWHEDIADAIERGDHHSGDTNNG